MCDHVVLHTDCADQWAARGYNNGCPVCRAPQVQELQARLVLLAAKIREQGVASFRGAFQPLFSFLQELASDRMFAREFIAMVRDLRILAQHPQQFRAELLRLRNPATEVAAPARSTLEAGRQRLMSFFQGGQRLLALGERMINPCPVDLDQMEMRAFALIGMMSMRYTSRMQMVFVQVLENLCEIIPEIGVLVLQLQEARNAGLSRHQLQEFFSPIFNQLGMLIIPMMPDVVAALRAGGGQLAATNPLIQAEMESFFRAIQELADLFRPMFN